MKELTHLGLCLALAAGLWTAGCGGSEGIDCNPHDHTACAGGVMRWVDSCGQPGGVIQTCTCGCSEDLTACELDCTCEPDCTGRECGDDGCGGSCGACTAPEACDADGLCACAPACEGRCCGGDGCGGTCPDGCAAGLVCDAGSCDCVADAVCTAGVLRCTGELAEICLADAWQTVADCAAEGQVCEGGACAACRTGQTRCAAEVIEVCSLGAWEPVLDCAASGKLCRDGACLECLEGALRCAGQAVEICADGGWQAVADCAAEGQACVDGACEVVCTPTCAGRACGDDGCGGSCGTCAGAGEVCAQVSGQCVVCSPDCAGLECGLEPVCGSSCGACVAPETCDAGGQCVCQPDCAGKECGGDGCGGECGACEPGEECSPEGLCTPWSTGLVGEPCTFGNVNAGAGNCVASLACLGWSADAVNRPCAVDADCDAFVDPTWNQDCVEGGCGASFCSAPCVDGACDPGYLPQILGGTCFCIPTSQPPATQDVGEPCQFDSVHVGVGGCLEGLLCLGMPPSVDTRPCALEGDCDQYLDPLWNPECVGGGCGASFCSAPCVDNACEPGFEVQAVAGGCYCVPTSHPNTAVAGEACRSVATPEVIVDCQAGLTCIYDNQNAVSFCSPACTAGGSECDLPAFPGGCCADVTGSGNYYCLRVEYCG
ncbi:MAG TPA: hypothetical protein PK668_12510 [Myxococcota bacterium]|nr:hypothetical protein [Myxococcota bacterium]HRY93708.1 hypothetical protein [Myxococcota bacterium]